MIAEYLRTREPLIEGKGEVSNEASVGKGGPFQQIVKTPIHKYMVVVILGGHIEGIRIDEKSDDKKKKKNDTVRSRVLTLAYFELSGMVHHLLEWFGICLVWQVASLTSRYSIRCNFWTPIQYLTLFNKAIGPLLAVPHILRSFSLRENEKQGPIGPKVISVWTIRNKASVPSLVKYICIQFTMYLYKYIEKRPSLKHPHSMSTPVALIAIMASTWLLRKNFFAQASLY